MNSLRVDAFMGVLYWSEFGLALGEGLYLWKGSHNTVMRSTSRLKARVEEAIKEIQSHLRADGGDIELVDVDHEGIVKVRLKGACVGCPMSQMTLQWGVERYLKNRIPEVKRVETV